MYFFNFVRGVLENSFVGGSVFRGCGGRVLRVCGGSGRGSNFVPIRTGTRTPTPAPTPPPTTGPTPVPPSSPGKRANKVLNVMASFHDLCPIRGTEIAVFANSCSGVGIVSDSLASHDNEAGFFSLSAPSGGLSVSPSLTRAPCTLCGVLMRTSKCLGGVRLGVPIFDNVGSVRQSSLVLTRREVSGAPRVFSRSRGCGLWQ